MFWADFWAQSGGRMRVVGAIMAGVGAAAVLRPTKCLFPQDISVRNGVSFRGTIVEILANVYLTPWLIRIFC